MTSVLSPNASAIYQGIASRSFPVVAYQAPAFGTVDVVLEIAEVARRMERVSSLSEVNGVFRLDFIRGLEHVSASESQGVAFMGVKKLDADITEIESKLINATPEDRLKWSSKLDRLKASKEIIDIPHAPGGNFAEPFAQPLKWLLSDAPDGVYVVTGWDEFLNGQRKRPETAQLFAAMASTFGCSKKSVVIVSSSDMDIPAELKMMPPVFKYQMPTAEQITAHLKPVIDKVPTVAKGLDIEISLTDDDYKSMGQGAQGLTLSEAYKVAMRYIYGRISERIDGYKVIDSGLIQELISFKTSKLADLGVHFAPPADVQPQGMGAWARWVEQRKALFWNKRETTLNVPSPKGALLVGPPGTGKTLAAKALAGQWNIPLLTLDISSLYSSLVGSSEQRLRASLELIEKYAPCAVLIDEIDKGAAGATDGGGDAGTSKRLFSMLLQWLNDKPSGIFVIATANDPSRIYKTMPELFRKGRFDQVFFVDLPTLTGRMDILRTHLASHNVEMSDENLRHLASESNLFSGSELKAAISDAATEAFCAGVDTITVGDVKNAFTITNPLAAMEGTNIEEVRVWAKNNARTASDPDESQSSRKGKAVSVVSGNSAEDYIEL
jgi:hypothetical protein